MNPKFCIQIVSTLYIHGTELGRNGDGAVLAIIMNLAIIMKEKSILLIVNGQNDL